MEASDVSDEVLALKSAGNEAYKEGNFEKAVASFTAALSLDPNNDAVLCNRSMAYGALKDWERSAADALKAVSITKNYEKAHFRLVKAHMELKNYKRAAVHLVVAFNECGPTKALKTLETELQQLTEIVVRPKSQDFEIEDQIGEGNFTKIYVAKYRPTKKKYAIKAIEKANVEKMKRRHPNIMNEILMEKRVLNKLEHPNIVTLYTTFQDANCIYYQMEYLTGGEVWDLIHEGEYAVGVHLTRVRYILWEAINALEYLHQLGIVHRDLKPENMLFTANGHLKLVDFGTAKDLVQTDLNGPEFVGTAEYMSPETVKSKTSDIAADLWALGVILYHMVVGETPFKAGSPYLTFLKIRQCRVQWPEFAPASVVEIMKLLIVKDKTVRLRNVLGDSSDVNYDSLRKMSFFHETADEVYVLPPEATPMLPALCIPSLKELALRAVGKACKIVCNEMAENGGVRPDIPWIKGFNLLFLSESDRHMIAQYLLRRRELHYPGIYRLFWPSVVDARTIRTDLTTREYIGHSHADHGHFTTDFRYAVISDPVLGMKCKVENPTSRATDPWEYEAEQFRKTISIINRSRPKFVIICGNMTNASFVENEEEWVAETHAVRRCIARISETIPVLCAPGEKDVGKIPTPATIEKYRSNYGLDYYGFWYGGLRCLVINSSLMRHPEGAQDMAADQDIWFREEVEQARLCATHLIIISHHPWFVTSADEPDSDTNMPRAVRNKWLPLLRHEKVKFIFSGAVRKTAQVVPYANVSPVVVPEEIEVTDAEENEVNTTKPSEMVAEAGDEVSDSESDVASDQSVDDPDDLEGYNSDDKDKKGVFSPDKKYNGPIEMILDSVGYPSDASHAPICFVGVTERSMTIESQ